MRTDASDGKPALRECATRLLLAEDRDQIVAIAVEVAHLLVRNGSGRDDVVVRFVRGEIDRSPGGPGTKDTGGSPGGPGTKDTGGSPGGPGTKDTGGSPGGPGTKDTGGSPGGPGTKDTGGSPGGPGTKDTGGSPAPIRDPQGRRFGFLMVEGPLEVHPELGRDLEHLSLQVEMALKAAEVADSRIRERSQAVFRAMVKNSSDQFSLIGRDLTIRSLSPSVERLLADRPEAVVGRSITEFVHPDDVNDFNDVISEITEGGNGCSSRLEYRVQYDDGSWRYIESVFTNLLDEPHIEGIVVNSQDNSARRNLEKELVRRELFDHLTGMPNRTLFLEKTNLALARASARRGKIAVVLLDFDDFQMVNDSFGHAAGDELLRAAGIKLETMVRSDDTIAHIGGDEFAILVAGGEMPRAAELVAERVFGILEDPISVEGAEYNIRVSVGIALGSAGMTADELLRNADLAVVSAKKNGKGRIEIFKDEMHDEVVKRLHTASDLRRAIGDGEVEPFFQPIVNVNTGGIIGAEALARWRHPERGLVQPYEFIPLAEATGLIVPMGLEILRKSCDQRVVWGANGMVDPTFYVSVNVSPIQLQRDDVVDVISNVIRDSGVDPTCVVLEITETCAMQRIEEMMKRLAELKKIGLRIALDDFGTGYSSLSYLSRLPMDIMKIDKSFVDGITGGNEELKIVKTMIDLGDSLDLTTLAEGVEEEGQLAVLNRLGCRSYQGFFFARPVPVDEFTALLSAQKKSVDSSRVALTN